MTFSSITLFTYHGRVGHIIKENGGEMDFYVSIRLVACILNFFQDRETYDFLE